MGSPPSAAQRTPWPRPRQSRGLWPEARWSEGAAPPSRPCRTDTAAPELKHSDDPPHAPWFASATHGPSVYPQPQPSGIPADPFSRSPYKLFSFSFLTVSLVVIPNRIAAISVLALIELIPTCMKADSFRSRSADGGFEICIDGLSIWLMRIAREIGRGTSVQAVWE